MVETSFKDSYALAQRSLCDRLHISWRSRFSPRARYEIASVIAIVGLILMLVTFAGIYAMYSTGGLADTFRHVCAQASISPVSLVTLVLVIGATCLLFGIYLLPRSSTPHTLLYGSV